MCIIAAKYFNNKGWVLAKNRDQDYVSNTSFKDEPNEKVGELLLMKDLDISYQEGMNHNGLVIISTSLTPNLSDETNKEDGDNIYKALQMDQKDAVNFLVQQEMTGFIFVATPEKLVVIEAARGENGKSVYKSKVTVAPKNKIVVRTNHGINLPWAGFQYGFSETQDVWRKSSESRKRIAEKVIQDANTPEEMLDALASKVADDLQLNCFRVENKPRQMRTIFQWALVPSESLVIIRPIQARMALKVTPHKIHIKVLDNEILKKVYNGRIRHFSVINVYPSEKGTEYKTVVKESFKEYTSKNS